jgi:hypothetical protein
LTATTASRDEPNLDAPRERTERQAPPAARLPRHASTAPARWDRCRHDMRTEVTIERVGLLSAMADFAQAHYLLVAAGVAVMVVVLWAALRADAREEASRRIAKR